MSSPCIQQNFPFFTNSPIHRRGILFCSFYDLLPEVLDSSLWTCLPLVDMKAVTESTTKTWTSWSAMKFQLSEQTKHGFLLLNVPVHGFTTSWQASLNFCVIYVMQLSLFCSRRTPTLAKAIVTSYRTSLIWRGPVNCSHNISVPKVWCNYICKHYRDHQVEKPCSGDV